MAKTIGILGGIGPQASVELYSRIIKISHEKYGAKVESDYPEIILYSLPLKGFEGTTIINEELVKKQLIEGLKKLVSAGSELIVISCNTVFSYYDELQSKTRVPIISIIEETKKKILSSGIERVGILATRTTIKNKLYQTALPDKKVITNSSSQQEMIDTIIENVISGQSTTNDKKKAEEAITNLQKQGAQGVILGCTELPVIIGQKDMIIPLFDTLEIAAEATLKRHNQ